MSVNSTIEWTDATWNPVRGCTKITPGCANCYAERFAERFRGVPGHPYEQGFDLKLIPQKLTDPLTWSASKMVFVNSMSDLFHKDIPPEYVMQVAQVMKLANWHTFQVLTKRAEYLAEMLQTMLAFAAECEHIWWGVSVENKKHGLPRVDLLRKSPAKVKFLSVEPLLEDLGDFDLTGIDWVIAGGESGAGARPLQKSWILGLRDLCVRSRVPFFFKQWGGFNKSKFGRELEGRTYDEIPTRTIANPPAKAERLKLIEQFESGKCNIIC